MTEPTQKNSLCLTLDFENNTFEYTSSIEKALEFAKTEIQALNETVDSVKDLKPNCDKIDYTVSAAAGALCGIIDVFLVGKPGESPLGDITDKWFANRTEGFAKLLGWDGKGKDSAIDFLEKKFKIPYDQRGAGDAASEIFNLTPKNHHFKSLGHNPTLLGLFFSILDQFTNQSHFISDGMLISLSNADGEFELHGENVPAKLFCGFINWFGHLISDISGSKGSKGRGMGIPSPIWAWTNDIIAIKSKLGISPSEFDKSKNELAVKLFEKGFDFRFQTTQLIPVFINEIIVRFFYAIRRLVGYFSNTPKCERSFKQAWKVCEPFSNPTVKRMLTVAHGTFCLVDISDAVVRGFAEGAGTFNGIEFFLRLNIPGIGRFAISLYGEVKQGVKIHKAESNALFAKREKIIVEYYIDGLTQLSEIYDDKNLVNFVDDLKNSDAYVSAFQKTVLLAKKRNVYKDKILMSKSDIDSYFNG